MVKLGDVNNKEVSQTSRTNAPDPIGFESDKSIFTVEDTMEKIAKQQTEDYEPHINMLIYGVDGVGKTGFALDWLVKNKIKTLIIDTDGTTKRLVNRLYKKEKENGLLVCYDPKEFYSNGEINPGRTVERLKSIGEMLNKKGNYGAFIFDGMTKAIEICDLSMRIEKKIDKTKSKGLLDVWVVRNEKFLTIYNKLNHVKGMHKFFIGHDNFLYKEGKTKTTSKRTGETLELSKTNKMVTGVHNGSDFKIKLKRYVNGKGEDEYVAIVEKYRDTLNLVGRKYSFAKITNEGSKWKSDTIMRIFNAEMPTKDDMTFEQIEIAKLKERRDG
jgi:hypothetical protein